MVHPETGEIDKHHSVNPVPMIIVNPNYVRKEEETGLEPTGILADIAPTILSFYGIDQPKGMNGINLVQNFTHSGKKEEEKSEAK